MSYLYREDLVLLCIPVWRSMWKYVTFQWLIARGKKKKLFLTWLRNLKVKSKQRVVFTQMSGQLTVCEAANLALLLCIQMTWISQVLLNWSIQLGEWSGETSSLEHVSGRHTNSNVLSKMPFSTTGTPPKQLVNGLAFQEKSVFHAWRVSPGGAISALLVFVLRAILGK